MTIRENYADMFEAMSAYADELSGDGKELKFRVSDRIKGHLGIEMDFEFGSVSPQIRKGMRFDFMRPFVMIGENATREAVATVLQSEAFHELVEAWDCEDVDGVEAAVAKMEFELAG